MPLTYNLLKGDPDSLVGRVFVIGTFNDFAREHIWDVSAIDPLTLVYFGVLNQKDIRIVNPNYLLGSIQSKRMANGKDFYYIQARPETVDPVFVGAEDVIETPGPQSRIHNCMDALVSGLEQYFNDYIRQQSPFQYQVENPPNLKSVRAKHDAICQLLSSQGIEGLYIGRDDKEKRGLLIVEHGSGIFPLKDFDQIDVGGIKVFMRNRRFDTFSRARSFGFEYIGRIFEDQIQLVQLLMNGGVIADFDIGYAKGLSLAEVYLQGCEVVAQRLPK
ncbi:MAG: hypothetical protein ABII01_06040 [Candidatus Woesearchaeota archaeon]